MLLTKVGPLSECTGTRYEGLVILGYDIGFRLLSHRCLCGSAETGQDERVNAIQAPEGDHAGTVELNYDKDLPPERLALCLRDFG